jgi:Uma2 family endonuclease
MSIATRQLGLADHGKPVDLDEFESADFEEGYKYELIDGRLYAAPAANEPEDWNQGWIYDVLRDFSREHPEVINRVSFGARVFLPRRVATTCPQPDVSAYRDYPVRRPRRKLRWQDVSPILVVEVLYDADPHKDLVRNVDLYLRVPSIREYWIVDARIDPDEPTLIVHRRRGKNWVKREYLYGETYQTKLLPGFKLLIDPHR